MLYMVYPFQFIVYNNTEITTTTDFLNFLSAKRL